MKVYTQSAQLIKYIVTGGLTTGVNYLIYFILLGAAGDAAQQSCVYLAANSAAWLGAVLFAYVMNRKLVFHSERAIGHEFLEFAGLRLATLAVENLLLYLLRQQLKIRQILLQLLLLHYILLNDWQRRQQSVRLI